MPSSRFNHVPIVIGIVRRLEPKSILDIGVGFGKWGHLFREYTDIVHSETDPPRYHREHWQTRIDGIEGYEAYITPAHRYLYNSIFIGDMRAKIREVGPYDVIFLGDVIEHVEKSDGQELLRQCLSRARKAVIVTTPADFVSQDECVGNGLEVHRSFWQASEFEALGRCQTQVASNSVLIAAFPREDAPSDLLTRPYPKRLWQRVKRRLQPLKRRFGHIDLPGPIEPPNHTSACRVGNNH